MDARTLTAFALMILIYIFFFQPPAKNPQSVSSNAIEMVEGKQEVVALQKSPKVAETSDLRRESHWLKNNKIEIEVDSLGSVKRAAFLKYKKAVRAAQPVDIFFTPEVFNSAALDTSAGPLHWSLVSAENGVVIKAVVAGLSVQRTISLVPDTYILKFSDEIENRSTQSIKANLNIQLAYPPVKKPEPVSFLKRIFSPSPEIHEAVASIDGSVSRDLFQKITQPIEKKGLVSWTGFSEKYFYFGIVLENISANTLKISPSVDSGFSQNLAATEKTLAPGEKANYTYNFYIGPKDLNELKKASSDLSEVVDYGSWLGVISRFLLSFLHLFYKIIPNFGVGIILLTILVKAALFPLAYKSAVSMRRLQVIQPKMKEIRDKYKDDKQRMNTEMMALYRTEKVNPVGGCLPMLLQMPVFFALYRVFFASIEFRQAPFFGWITDLSVHDHYFVTPVLMTALMWYQAKLTPQPPAMEETEAVQVQRTMMKWMPIIFGAIMIFLPSGLTLYFLVNALLSLVQQLYINRKLGLPLSTPQTSV